MAVRIQVGKPLKDGAYEMKSHLQGAIAQESDENSSPKLWQRISRLEADPIKTKIRQVGCQNPGWQALKDGAYEMKSHLQGALAQESDENSFPKLWQTISRLEAEPIKIKIRQDGCQNPGWQALKDGAYEMKSHLQGVLAQESDENSFPKLGQTISRLEAEPIKTKIRLVGCQHPGWQALKDGTYEMKSHLQGALAQESDENGSPKLGQTISRLEADPIKTKIRQVGCQNPGWQALKDGAYEMKSHLQGVLAQESDEISFPKLWQTISWLEADPIKTKIRQVGCQNPGWQALKDGTYEMKSHLQGVLAQESDENSFPKLWQTISRLEADPIKTKMRQVGCQNPGWQALKDGTYEMKSHLQGALAQESDENSFPKLWQTISRLEAELIKTKIRQVGCQNPGWQALKDGAYEMKSHLQGALAQESDENSFPKLGQTISRLEAEPIKTKIRQVGCQNSGWQALKVSNIKNVLLPI